VGTNSGATSDGGSTATGGSAYYWHLGWTNGGTSWSTGNSDINTVGTTWTTPSQNSFTGIMSGTVVFPTQLSASQVSALYNTGGM